MNFKDIAKDVASAAPVLGTLLGGPAGGLVGGWIAKAFGVSSGSAQDVLSALTADRDSALKLKQIELDHEKDIASIQQQQAIAELQAARDTVIAVNQTMQSESKSEHWPQWAWRPFWGFASGAAFFCVCILFCILAWQAVFQGNEKAMTMIPNLVSSFTGLFGIAGAVLGITSFYRGKEKLQRAINDGNNDDSTTETK